MKLTKYIFSLLISLTLISFVSPNNNKNSKVIMSTSTFIRTENTLGPGLSKSFQSFISGPDIDGNDCELHQIEKILQLNLKSFTLMNYSGMWDESEFPDDPKVREELIIKQKEQDLIWNELMHFNNLVADLISAIENKKLKDNLIKHQYAWWNGYFDIPDEQLEHKDYFVKDLRIIHEFLNNMAEKGETKTAFYVD